LDKKASRTGDGWAVAGPTGAPPRECKNYKLIGHLEEGPAKRPAKLGKRPPVHFS
jgi:hypothetical protein